MWIIKIWGSSTFCPERSLSDQVEQIAPPTCAGHASWVRNQRGVFHHWDFEVAFTTALTWPDWHNFIISFYSQMKNGKTSFVLFILFYSFSTSVLKCNHPFVHPWGPLLKGKPLTGSHLSRCLSLHFAAITLDSIQFNSMNICWGFTEHLALCWVPKMLRLTRQKYPRSSWHSQPIRGDSK